MRKREESRLTEVGWGNGDGMRKIEGGWQAKGNKKGEWGWGEKEGGQAKGNKKGEWGLGEKERGGAG